MALSRKVTCFYWLLRNGSRGTFDAAEIKAFRLTFLGLAAGETAG